MCVAVTLLDDILVSRSVFETGVGYRSVVVLGRARVIEGPAEKLRALEAFSERIIPGHWAVARKPNEQEMKGTAVLAIPLDECSAKVSEGPPEDANSPDGELPVWAGNIPLKTVALEPVTDPGSKIELPPPPYAMNYRRPGWR